MQSPAELTEWIHRIESECDLVQERIKRRDTWFGRMDQIAFSFLLATPLPVLTALVLRWTGVIGEFDYGFFASSF